MKTKKKSQLSASKAGQNKRSHSAKKTIKKSAATSKTISIVEFSQEKLPLSKFYKMFLCGFVLCLIFFIGIALLLFYPIGSNTHTCKEGCAVDRRPQGLVDKPIIYLYPEEETEVSVRLGKPGNLTHTYPPYKDGWHVVAEPDGNLTEKGTERELYALYWEGKTAKEPIISEGFVVAGSDTISFLEEKLPLLGLSPRETEEFIIYWLPQLESNRYNLIRFLPLEEQEENMSLSVTPTPDTVIRVLMAFKPLVRPVRIKEQTLPETPERNGFVVVEWGGTKLGTDLLQ